MASARDATNRAEIDTSLPFSSVKAAVSMFGEKSEAMKSKKQCRHEEHEGELKNLRNELAGIKLRLKNAENSKIVALAEFRSTKKGIDKFQQDRPESLSHGDYSTNAEETGPEVIMGPQEQHVEAMVESDSLRRSIQEPLQELSGMAKKDYAVGEVQRALRTAEADSKAADASLMLMKQTCVEAKKGVHHTSHWPHQDVSTIEELELKLAAATKDLAMLHKELATGDEARQQISLAASEALLNLSGAKSENRKPQLVVSDPTISVPLQVSSSRLLNDESTAKDLQKTMETRACLESSMKALQAELEAMTNELYELKDREANASAAVVTLTRELFKVKTELMAAIRTESKATEAILGLSNALHQVTAEAEQAKEEANALIQGANQAKADAELAKAVINDADRRLQEAMKSVEAEANALQSFRNLYDRTIAEADCGSQIPWNEYLMAFSNVGKAPPLPQSLNLNTERVIQLANDQSPMHKKKKHLISSLSSLLGKKGHQASV